MKSAITAAELRATLPQVVATVGRGARFTVLYRNRPAFQVVPAASGTKPPRDLNRDPLYRAKPVGRSKAKRSSAHYDALCCGR